METDFSDEPGWFCDGGPHRAVQNQGSCCTGRPRRTVRYRKRPCGVREVHLSTGAARGSGSNAGRHVERVAGASESWWRIVMTQVRRMPMRARWLQSRCDGSPMLLIVRSDTRAVADNILIQNWLKVLPVSTLPATARMALTGEMSVSPRDRYLRRHVKWQISFSKRIRRSRSVLRDSFVVLHIFCNTLEINCYICKRVCIPYAELVKKEN